MQLGIQDKVALVAAGSKGIGLAIAQSLQAEGARVAVCSRTQENLSQARKVLGSAAHYFEADVTQASDLERWHAQVVRDLGVPQILVTNTGGPPPGRALELSDEAWLQGVEATLLPVVRLVRLVTPAMRATGWGRIVHLTSIAAREPHPLLAISSTLRRGITALTKLQAQELGPHGITVNALLPGHTRTDRQQELAEIKSHQKGITVDQYFTDLAAHTPVRRLAEPAEIAAVAAFLCSERASFVTGTAVLADGGASHA